MEASGDSYLPLLNKHRSPLPRAKWVTNSPPLPPSLSTMSKPEKQMSKARALVLIGIFPSLAAGEGEDHVFFTVTEA
jgi:hypothetical protein